MRKTKLMDDLNESDLVTLRKLQVGMTDIADSDPGVIGWFFARVMASYYRRLADALEKDG